MSKLSDNTPVIVDCVRTPIGRAHAERGWYRDVRSDDLAAHCVRALVERAGFVVVSLGNSPPVRGRGRSMGAQRASLSTLAAAVATGTGGRWLVAPAIELYARRPADASAEP